MLDALLEDLKNYPDYHVHIDDPGLVMIENDEYHIRLLGDQWIEIEDLKSFIEMENNVLIGTSFVPTSFEELATLLNVLDSKEVDVGRKSKG